MLCMALDPIASPTQSGRMVNRHCVNPAGHQGWHETYDRHGQIVHSWLWEAEETTSVVLCQPSLFDNDQGGA